MQPRILVTSILLALGTVSVFAQAPASTLQRDVNQQNRIEQGLQSGSLNTKEAGRLEKEESRVDRIQANALKDGKLTPQESARLEKAQDKVSQDIKAAKSNDVKGNPQSASSQRMQADVQRNANEEKRIEQGVQSGTVTNREAAKLERGQSRVDRREAAAARDGHVGANEQAAIQRKENHQSGEIYEKKNNTSAVAPAPASTLQRDVNQQNRIEQGLQSGSLNTKEAGRLEKEESRVDRIQANALKDGKLTPQESARLEKAQDKVSQDIKAAKSNDVKGNPQSASSQRMQADVQRNANEEKRIEQGVQSGTVTNREAANLERGQARVDHREAVAARDGHVGANEQAAIQRKENRQSAKIFKKKHNDKDRQPG